MKYRKGSIIEVVDHNPDGTKDTRKVEVVSARKRRYKNGVEWTLLHIKDIETARLRGESAENGGKEVLGHCQGCGGVLTKVEGAEWLECAPCSLAYKNATPKQRGTGTW